MCFLQGANSTATEGGGNGSGSVIEADAVFAPESDPCTHVLPPEFHFNAAKQSANSYTTQDTPPSFMHDATPAPEPSVDPPIDPLDPDFIAKTIADSNIYEELYAEFGMGEQFPPDSDDEAEGESEAGSGEVCLSCLSPETILPQE